MFVSLIATIVVFIIFRSRKNPLLDPYTIFFLAYLYYCYYIPVLMILSGFYEVGELGVFVTDQNLKSLSYLYFFSFLFFSATYRGLDHLMAKRFLPEPAPFNPALERRTVRMQQLVLAAGVAAIFGLAVIVFPSEVAAIRADYGNKIYTVYTNSTFAAIQNFWLSLLGVAVAHALLYTPRPVKIFIMTAVAMCVLSFATYSKTPFIFILFLGFVMFYRVARNFQLPAVALFVGGFMLALVTVVPSFSQYRATGIIELVNFADMNVQQTFSDARGPLFTTILSLNYANAPQIPPLSYSWILWLPRFIWSSRPYDVAEAFAQANMPGWQPGFGYGMSPITEGILRFDSFFAPLIFIFFAVTIVLQRHLLLSLLNERLRPAADMVAFGQLMFFTNRGPLSALMTSTLQFWLPFLLMLFLAQAFFGADLLGQKKRPQLIQRMPVRFRDPRR
jgi:hypothetical protein